MNTFKTRSVLVYRRQDAFTLIELLIVVAIIGIMASVVLAALNSAKNKGGDAGVKANLRNAIPQAEVLYSSRLINSNTYINVCANGPVEGNLLGIGSMVLAAAKNVGLSSVNLIGTAGGYNAATCHVSAVGNAWAAEVPLNGSTAATPRMWCVDSSGKSKPESDNLTLNGVSCT